MSHRPASCDFHRLILHQAILVLFFKRVRTYRLRMTVPNLSIGALLWGLQCCVVSTVERRFFFLCIDHVHSFWETRAKQQNQEKCRGGYFRRDNRDHLVPGFQTGPISTLTGAEWSCARSVLASNHYLSEFRKQTGRQYSKRNTRKHRRQSLRKKNQWTWLRSPPRSKQNHHKTDPKQQCDRDANDATKSFDAESYDFDTVWPGPKAHLLDVLVYDNLSGLPTPMQFW